MKLIRYMMLACTLLVVGFAQAELKEGEDYTRLPTPIAQTHSNKIEVLEFFAYFCPHCEHLEPVLLETVRQWPADVYLRKEHVIWQEGDFGLARIASAVNSSGLVHQASPAVFQAIFTQRLNLADERVFDQWAKTQPFGQDLLRAYHAPTVSADVQRMQKLTKDQKIGSVPTLIVGGRYVLKLTNDYPKSMKNLNELIEKVRKERGMKAPKSAAATQTVGMALAMKAGQ